MNVNDLSSDMKWEFMREMGLLFSQGLSKDIWPEVKDQPIEIGEDKWYIM